MPNAEDILWFKQQFHSEIEVAVNGSLFSLDMLTAIACQETGYIWQVLRKRQLSIKRILELCVGDTLDSSGGRKPFPQTKADLVGRPNGQQMFEIARQALVDMAQYISGYQKVAAKPNKFCHGFGIFQYDLQFFTKDPDYFLQKRYADFDACVSKCIGELQNAIRRIGWQDKTKLTDYEMACVGIAYNTGGFKPRKGLKQGHFDGQKYYGEAFFDFLRLSKSVALDGESPASLLSTQVPGNALVPPPSPVEATGQLYEVEVSRKPSAVAE